MKMTGGPAIGSGESTIFSSIENQHLFKSNRTEYFPWRLEFLTDIHKTNVALNRGTIESNTTARCYVYRLVRQKPDLPFPGFTNISVHHDAIRRAKYSETNHHYPKIVCKEFNTILASGARTLGPCRNQLGKRAQKAYIEISAIWGIIIYVTLDNASIKPSDEN